MKKILAIAVAAWAGLVGATVPNEVTKVSYLCDGSARTFAYTFKIINAADLVVSTDRPSTLVAGTDYSLTGVGAATGGTVTLVAASRCPNGNKITLARTVDYKQSTSFRSQSTYNPAVHENAFDKLAMGLQQLAGKIGTGGGGTSTLPQTVPPVSSQTAGAVADGVTTNLTSTDSTALIYYCLGVGCTPVGQGTGGSGATSYSVVLHPPVTLRAFAAAPGKAASDVTEWVYTLYTPSQQDVVAPTVTGFTLATSAVTVGDTVQISTLTATDNVAVTGVMVTSSSTAPSATGAGWTAPGLLTSFVSPTSAGNWTIYAWAKDAAGNVSTGRAVALTVNQQILPAPTIAPASGSVPWLSALTINTVTTPAVTVTYYVSSAATYATATPVNGVVTVPNAINSASSYALAWVTATGYTQSPITRRDYTSVQPTLTATATPAPGTYSSAQTFTISFSPTAASIHYCITTVNAVCTPSTTYTTGVSLTPPARIMVSATPVDSTYATYGPIPFDYVAPDTSCVGTALRGSNVHYVCDCQTGADGSCVAGADTNEAVYGMDSAHPLQTIEAALGLFNALPAGGTVALCRGGAWATGNQQSFLQSTNACAANSTCMLRDYVPSWGSSSTAKPKIFMTGGYNSLSLGSCNASVNGLQIWNLDFRRSPEAVDSTGDLLDVGGLVSGVDICNVNFQGSGVGLNFNGIGAGNRVRESQFNNLGTGMTGGAADLVVSKNVFTNTGVSSGGFGNAFAAGNTGYCGSAGMATLAMTIRDNHFIANGAQALANCRSAQLYLFGQHNGTVVSNNLFEINAQAGCGAVDNEGYAYSKRNLSYTRNYVIVQGAADTKGISIQNCESCSATYNVVDMLNSGIGISVTGQYGANLTQSTNVNLRYNTIYNRGGGTSILAQSTSGSLASYVGNAAWNNGSACLSATVPVTTNSSNYCAASGVTAAAIWKTPASGDLRPLNPGALVGTLATSDAPTLPGYLLDVGDSGFGPYGWQISGLAKSGVSAPYDIGAYWRATVSGTPAAPSAPSITSPSGGFSVPANTLLTVSGTTAQAGGTVTLYDNGVGVGSCSLVAQAFSCAVPPSAMTAGSHQFTAKQTDAFNQTSVASASVSGTATVAAPNPPVVNSFTTSPSTITAGGSATFSCSVTNATTMSINNGVGTVTGSCTVSVQPTVTTTYVLTTNNAGGVPATASTTVTVVPANQTFVWAPLKVGAGGFITGSDADPTGATYLIRTDTYGAYVSDATGAWNQVVTATSMPASYVSTFTSGTTQSLGEGVWEIRVAPSNPNTIYMHYHGSIWKSTDRGVSWTATSGGYISGSLNPNGTYRYWGEKMAVDPANPSVVYAGAAGGLYVTSDGGATWSLVSGVPAPTTGSGGTGVTCIVFDSSGGMIGNRTANIYAVSNGNGVYRTTNGSNWSAVAGGPSTCTHAAVASDGTYYAAHAATSVAKYAAGAWTNTAVLDGSLTLYSVTVDPTSAVHVSVGSDGGYIGVSSNGGASWTGGAKWTVTRSATDIPWLATANESYMTNGAIRFDPATSNKLWFAEGIGVWTCTNPDASTIAWVSRSAGIDQLVGTDVALPPTTSIALLSGLDRSVWVVPRANTSYPSSYVKFGSGANLIAAWAVDYSRANPQHLVALVNRAYGGSEPLVSGYSLDSGATWTAFPNQPGGSSANGGSIVATSIDSIIAVTGSGYAYRTTDRGATAWTKLSFPGDGGSDTPNFGGTKDWRKHILAVDGGVSTTVYAYFYTHGIYKSVDSGATWTLTSSSSFDGGAMQYQVRLKSVPGQAGHLFMAPGQSGGGGEQNPAATHLWRSTDSGATWSQVSGFLEPYEVALGAAAPGQTYPAIYVAGWYNGTYGIWQSINNASTWTQIGPFPNNNFDWIRAMNASQDVYGEVYVAMSGSGWMVRQGTTTGSAPTFTTNLTANPSSITSGNSSTLSWVLSNSISATMDNGVGDVTGLTSKSVSPGSTTTYHVTGTNNYGSTPSAGATVTVSAAHANVSIINTPVGAPCTSASSCAAAITTSGASRVVVVVTARTASATIPSVTSVTASGLTFAKDSLGTGMDWTVQDAFGHDVEIWSATSAGALSSVTITVNMSATSDIAWKAFAITSGSTVGQKITQTHKTSSVSPVALSFSGLTDGSMVIGAEWNGDLLAASAGSGTTIIDNQNNAGAFFRNTNPTAGGTQTISVTNASWVESTYTGVEYVGP